MRCGKCWKERDQAKFRRVVPEHVATVCASCWYELDTWMGWMASEELVVSQQTTLPGIPPGVPPLPPQNVDSETGEVTDEVPQTPTKKGRANS